MELFAEALSVIGALLLSVSCGLLFEELLFGGLVRLFFARRPAASTTPERTQPTQRTQPGEHPCLR